jgi:hypothetical protein
MTAPNSYIAGNHAQGVSSPLGQYGHGPRDGGTLRIARDDSIFANGFDPP